MQGYYDIPTDDTSMDFQYWLDYAIDHERHTPPAMQPCKNVDCGNSSYAIFCSEDCRIILEGLEQEVTDYYSDGEGVLLGHRQLSDDQAALDGDLVAKACGYAPAVAAPVVQALPEAAASATVRLTIAGHSDVLFTVRDMDETRLLERLEALLSRFPVQPPAVQEPAHLCPVHGVSMEQQTNAKGSWWSHRTASGWCKGRKAA